MDWQSIAAYSAVALLIALMAVLYWKRPDRRREAALGAGSGVAVAIVGIWLHGRTLSSDAIATIVGSAAASFGGAWFAFYLQRGSSLRDERRRFRIDALETLQQKWSAGGAFSMRGVDWYDYKVDLYEISEVERLVRRTGSASLKRLFDAMREFAHETQHVEKIAKTDSGLELSAEFMIAIDDFVRSQKMLIDTVELLLNQMIGNVDR